MSHSSLISRDAVFKEDVKKKEEEEEEELVLIQGGPERMQHLRSIISRKRGTE